MRRQDIRNVAIIAHVDHGKTTLVDCMLRQSGRYRDTQLVGEQILDSNDLERERGITILAKNIAIPYHGVKINIIDTPGHADFGGEVERVLRMADGALVLVDAAEGPMPQTRFVLSKALECGLQPIVVINKIDRPDARPHEVLDEVFELFLQLGADDRLADFPLHLRQQQAGLRHARSGPARRHRRAADGHDPGKDSRPGDRSPKPRCRCSSPRWTGPTTSAASPSAGCSRARSAGQNVALMQKDDQITPAKIVSVYVFEDLGRVEVESAAAGDIVALVGLEDIEIGDTVADRESPRALPRLMVDEPTLKMTFGVNTSPLAGREGKYLTSRHLRERLMQELQKNVALRVEPIAGTEQFSVSGRGILHLSVLIETMRREGYELSIGKPQVIFHEIDGMIEEPFESLVVEVPENQTGPVMELVGQRRGAIGRDAIAQQLLVHDLFDSRAGTDRPADAAAERHAGHGRDPPSLRGATSRWKARSDRGPPACWFRSCPAAPWPIGLDTLQQRAELHVGPGDVVYEGMIVGENSRTDDMNVNPTKEKKLSNMRAVGHDRNILLKPARRMSLEEALEFIDEDELVEVTPTQIRLRKIMLNEHDRKRAARKAAAVGV